MGTERVVFEGLVTRRWRLSQSWLTSDSVVGHEWLSRGRRLSQLSTHCLSVVCKTCLFRAPVGMIYEYLFVFLWYRLGGVFSELCFSSLCPSARPLSSPSRMTPTRFKCMSCPKDNAEHRSANRRALAFESPSLSERSSSFLIAGKETVSKNLGRH